MTAPVSENEERASDTIDSTNAANVSANFLETISTWSWQKLLLMGIGILAMVLGVYLIFKKMPFKPTAGEVTEGMTSE